MSTLAVVQDSWTPEALKEEVEREKQLRAVVVDYYKSQLRADHHYYTLPGQEKRKPALAKEGALNLCSLFKVVPEPAEPHEVMEENGHYTVRYRYVLRAARTGQIVATGDGSCSTRESKYAHRWLWEWEVPQGTDTTGLRSRRRKTSKGLWKTQYRFANDELADTYNTVLKMASKRALVDAALKLPLVSELFTQDLEEQIGEREELEPDIVEEPAGGGKEAGTDRAAQADPSPPPPQESRKASIARLNRAFVGAGLSRDDLRDKARQMFGRDTIKSVEDLSDAEVSALADEVDALRTSTVAKP